MYEYVFLEKIKILHQKDYNISCVKKSLSNKYFLKNKNLRFKNLS